jgi:hypothetical protein
VPAGQEKRAFLLEWDDELKPLETQHMIPISDDNRPHHTFRIWLLILICCAVFVWEISWATRWIR